MNCLFVFVLIQTFVNQRISIPHVGLSAASTITSTNEIYFVIFEFDACSFSFQIYHDGWHYCLCYTFICQIFNFRYEFLFCSNFIRAILCFLFILFLFAIWLYFVLPLYAFVGGFFPCVFFFRYFYFVHFLCMVCVHPVPCESKHRTPSIHSQFSQVLFSFHSFYRCLPVPCAWRTDHQKQFSASNTKWNVSLNQ